MIEEYICTNSAQNCSISITSELATSFAGVLIVPTMNDFIVSCFLFCLRSCSLVGLLSMRHTH